MVLHFDPSAQTNQAAPTPDTALLGFGPQLPSLKQARVLLIEEALRRAGGNQSLAAAMIGVSRQAINKYLQPATGDPDPDRT